MKLYIYPNLTEERYIEKVKKALEVLKGKGHECILNKEDGHTLYGEESFDSGSIDDCDLIVSLGGDGTFLRGNIEAVRHDKPICGINCGNVGYLCACQLKDIEDLDLDSLQETDVSMLEMEYEGKTYSILNEVIIGKDYFGGTVELEYEIGPKTDRFRGDGMILCTATGSTAYNYSAGGEIFKDEDRLIGITPICAHNRHARPFRIDESENIRVRLLNPKYSATIYADGIVIGPMTEIFVRSGRKKARVLK
ncbi:MAG: NAD(+)/NADH kinase [Erysipelotrichaceae bacterium]|nr:NAD(+)/NADH kinase [Erysipelotrichaceae bacterium]